MHSFLATIMTGYQTQSMGMYENEAVDDEVIKSSQIIYFAQLSLLSLSVLVNTCVLVRLVTKGRYRRSYHLAYGNLASTDLVQGLYVVIFTTPRECNNQNQAGNEGHKYVTQS